MKSNWDDVPDYVRYNKKQSPWRMVVILGVGSAITWGLIALFAKPIVIDVNQLKQAISVDGQPLFGDQPAQVQATVYSEPTQPIRLPSLPLEPTQPVVQQTASKAEIEWVERAEAIATERAKNSFNDNNYRPKQPANIYTPPVTQTAYAPAVSEQKPRQVSRERTAKWIKSWSGGTNYLGKL
jgi:hypothetical protein